MYHLEVCPVSGADLDLLEFQIFKSQRSSRFGFYGQRAAPARNLRETNDNLQLWMAHANPKLHSLS